MTGIFSTGTSALLAFQRALTTVGHNVANVNTPGYSRQRVEMEARTGSGVGRGYTGGGVDIANLRRLADGLVFARQTDSSGELGRLKQVSQLSGRVDALLSDKATSLSAPWSAFFTAADGVAADPTSNTARGQLLDSARTLASRWQSMDRQLSQLDHEIDTRIAGTVGDINRLSAEIAQINRDVVAAGSNVTPDLLDARALRVDQLAGLVGVETHVQDDGAMNVFTAGGQPLVLGTRTQPMSTMADPYQPGRLQLALSAPTGAVPLPASSVAGELGGLLEFRGRVLDPARAELGRMATAFAVRANELQQSGVDFNGQPGAALFTLPPPHIAAHPGNAGGGANVLTAVVDDLGALKSANFVLQFDGSAWSARRSGDNTLLPISGTGAPGNPLRVAGLAIEVGTPAPVAGDRYAVSPTAAAASGISVALSDPFAIAAASPLQAARDTGNIGNASPASAQVTDPALFAGFAGAVIEFLDSNTYMLDGVGPITYAPGTPITGPGWSLSMTGTPAAGDRFTLARTPARSADNGNARQLAALDDVRLIDGGSTSLTTGLSQITARAGSEARHADMTMKAQQAIHDQVIAERESVSGVNLDEEAADLLRFQQAYQAAAQVIATADSMFQTLLGAVRR